MRSQLIQRYTTATIATRKSIFIILLPSVLVSSYSTTTTTTTTTTTVTTNPPSSIHNRMSRATLLYEPYRKYPELFGDTFLEEWLHPDMIELVKTFKKQYSSSTSSTCTIPTKEVIDASNEVAEAATKISPYLTVESDGVYSFQCLSENFLHIFNEEIQNFYIISEKYNIPVRRPNSMNNYGVIVNDIGMMNIISSLQQNYIWPIARLLFPFEGSSFNDHHSFIVRYKAGEDLGLDMHTDDSDVTFNVCLGDTNFTGATLVFCGMFGSSNHRIQSHVYNHQVGRAVIHLGSRRHGAENIESGTRQNLIVWNHNWSYRSSHEYAERRHTSKYEKEERKPDQVCLSYTHDRDYTKYKSIPDNKKNSMHFHGWCPPEGKEYDGYYDDDDDDNGNNDHDHDHDNNKNDDTKQQQQQQGDIIRSQDEL